MAKSVKHRVSCLVRFRHEQWHDGTREGRITPHDLWRKISLDTLPHEGMLMVFRDPSARMSARGLVRHLSWDESEDGYQFVVTGKDVTQFDETTDEFICGMLKHRWHYVPLEKGLWAYQGKYLS